MTSQNLSPEQLTLYISPFCPYCHRVTNALAELGFDANIKAGDAGGITLKNTFMNRQATAELRQGGGKSTVPCLRIDNNGEVQWLYESLDIVAFLRANLAQ